MVTIAIWILIIHSYSTNSWNHETSQSMAVAEFNDREACVSAGEKARENFGKQVAWICARKSSEKPVNPEAE